MSRETELGIEAQYRDVWGVLRTSPEATVASLVAALTSVAPDRAAPAPDAPVRGGAPCFRPAWMATERVWGIAVQLYGVRSPRNWGIGDFSDLSRLVENAASVGADFVGVSPLHALYAADPSRFSPYSPSSREFLNVLFIDPTAMLAYAGAPAARRAVERADVRRRLARLRDAEFVDYADVAACKEMVFRLIHAEFRETVGRSPDHPLAVDFARFRREGGEPLRRFALYQTLSCRPGFGPHWQGWPETYHDPASTDVATFADENDTDILYHVFLQWEADAQLARCAAVARAAGMRIGLYLDLAVGTAPGSAEAWSEQRAVIAGFHVGAPPDEWNPDGQDWGLAAPNPLALAHDRVDSYRRIVGAVMRHAGAIRIDHVLGFHRLYLVAAGGAPRDGVYLRMPASRVCEALAEESVARQCLVIGEDLGTVPQGFHDLMARYGILSYRLLIFGKDGNRYLAPADYPANAVVAVSTHDLPPLLGFWSGHDLGMRTALGLAPDESARPQAQADRAADGRALATAFAAAGYPAAVDERSILVAAHGFLARTPCRLLIAQMEDLAMAKAQANLPGSDDRHPNWRRKLDRDLDAIFADETAGAIFAAIRAERPTRPRR